MDPVTTAIIAAATASVTEVGKKGFVDAYEALKKKIAEQFDKGQKILPVIKKIDEKPALPFLHDELAYEISEARADKAQELLELAQALRNALAETSGGQKALAKYNIAMTNSQTGVVGDNTKIEGGLHIGSPKA